MGTRNKIIYECNGCETVLEAPRNIVNILWSANIAKDIKLYRTIDPLGNMRLIISIYGVLAYLPVDIPNDFSIINGPIGLSRNTINFVLQINTKVVCLCAYNPAKNELKFSSLLFDRSEGPVNIIRRVPPKISMGFSDIIIE